MKDLEKGKTIQYVVWSRFARPYEWNKDLLFLLKVHVPATMPLMPLWNFLRLPTCKRLKMPLCKVAKKLTWNPLEPSWIFTSNTKWP